MNISDVCPLAGTCRMKGCSMCVSSKGETSECEHYRKIRRRLDRAKFVGFVLGEAFFLFVELAVAVYRAGNDDAIDISQDLGASAGTRGCEMRSGD